MTMISIHYPVQFTQQRLHHPALHVVPIIEITAKTKTWSSLRTLTYKTIFPIHEFSSFRVHSLSSLLISFFVSFSHSFAALSLLILTQSSSLPLKREQNKHGINYWNCSDWNFLSLLLSIYSLFLITFHAHPLSTWTINCLLLSTLLMLTKLIKYEKKLNEDMSHGWWGQEQNDDVYERKKRGRTGKWMAKKGKVEYTF